MRVPPRPQLDDVLLSNNPKPTSKTGWAKLSQREYDFVTWDFGVASWSIACNRDRVGPGSVGWIHRADGSFGHLAGLIVFDDTPSSVREPGGTVDHCTGILWRLPREWWIDGARVALHPAWSGRAPFGATRRFRNGEQLKIQDRDVLWEMLHPVARDWVEAEVASLQGP
ncbi:hypothetical protein P0Y31_09580 [Knoellia sp. 3-2P3]|uniref:hypothetical protein n=1 Tax=unclassified Knoellia TaxID=2618719 RepID=UPI0023DC979C|nr:hypothetical protein [Knoellia sp. 3-2P3]MDF2092594.1 hypothetical protein [Knoellia sp. 3-2P3]